MRKPPIVCSAGFFSSTRASVAASSLFTLARTHDHEVLVGDTDERDVGARPAEDRFGAIGRHEERPHRVVRVAADGLRELRLPAGVAAAGGDDHPLPWIGVVRLERELRRDRG